MIVTGVSTGNFVTASVTAFIGPSVGGVVIASVISVTGASVGGDVAPSAVTVAEISVVRLSVPTVSEPLVAGVDTSS